MGLALPQPNGMLGRDELELRPRSVTHLLYLLLTIVRYGGGGGDTGVRRSNAAGKIDSESQRSTLGLLSVDSVFHRQGPFSIQPYTFPDDHGVEGHPQARCPI